MTIYGISGLGADERVFQYLELSQKIEPINWIKPLYKESMHSYCNRLSNQIIDDDFVLIAVSFGGLVAIELNKILKPKYTILISSAETKQDLRKIYKLFGKLGFINLLPGSFFNLPNRIMSWLFGAKNKTLLKEILKDTDPGFAKWAIVRLTTWQNQTRFDNLIKIHGSGDKLLVYKKQSNTILVEKGEHFMIVDRANEISRIIEDILRKNVANYGASDHNFNHKI